MEKQKFLITTIGTTGKECITLKTLWRLQTGDCDLTKLCFHTLLLQVSKISIESGGNESEPLLFMG